MPEQDEERERSSALAARDGSTLDPNDLIAMREVTDKSGPYALPPSTLYALLHEHPEVGPFTIPGRGHRSFLVKSLLEPLLRPQHKPLGGARPSVNP